MKKGFTITYNKANSKEPWRIKFIGNRQIISHFDFGDGTEPVLKCLCGKVHWEDRGQKKND